LALAQQRPPEYTSASFSREQVLIATGSFEASDLSEVLRRRKDLHWSPQTKLIASLFNPGHVQDALTYIIQTDDIREMMKLMLCFKDLVRWKIASAVPIEDEMIDDLIE
jgi:mannose/cellobiose epimerase-like protein (N-acyl-D-glucosamine 2-epimerase family)